MIRKTDGLIDENDRRRAADELKTTFLVEAGAGTGKTAVLVSRIVTYLSSEGGRSASLAAITFTENAAAELKTRIRDGLEAHRQKVVDAKEGARVAENLTRLDQAFIGTIHSFCAHLLKKRPVEADLDPAFSVADEMESFFLFEDLWTEWMGRDLAARPAVFMAAMDYGISLEKIKSIADRLVENMDLWPEWKAGHPLPDGTGTDGLKADYEELYREYEDLWSDAKSSCRNKEDALYQRMSNMNSVFENIDLKREGDSQILLFMDLKPVGNQKNWDSAESLKELKKRIKEWRLKQSGLKERAGRRVVENCLIELEGFLSAWRERKESLGRLTYHDLLLRARDLLRDRLDVRRDFQRQYGMILVDEFHDTDPLQAEIIFFLCEREPVARRWDEVHLEPGKLFLVGDPKQSIYRFRRADADVYSASKDIIGKQGVILNIVANFRSHPGLLSWVNDRFRAIIVPSSEGRYQPPYVPLQPGPGHAPADSPRVHSLNPAPGQLKNKNMDVLRKMEAEAIGDFLKSEVIGKWTVRDPQTKQNRPAGYRDVAVLFRVLTHFHIYETAFEKSQIPFWLQGGKDYYRRWEVQALVNLLNAVENPWDSVSLYASLHSALFGYSDSDLFELFANRRVNYLEKRFAELPSYQEVFEKMARWHRLRGQYPLDVWLEKILDESQAWTIFLAKPYGEQRVESLRKILDVARRLADQGLDTPSHLIHWLRGAQEMKLEEESASSGTEGDYVRMLTIHKSKGLEYPVVVLAGLGDNPNLRPDFFIAAHGRGGFQLNTGTVNSPAATEGWNDAEREETRHLEAQDRRLFYVACTRARDFLILPRFYKPGREGQIPEKSYLEMLRAAQEGEKTSSFERDHSAGESSGSTPQPLYHRLDTKKYLRLHESIIEKSESQKVQWTLHRKNILKTASASRDVAVTEWVKKERDFAAEGGEGPRFGSYIHTLLEKCDLKRMDDDSLRAWSEYLSPAEHGRDWPEKACRIVRDMMKIPLMKRASRAERVFREIPFDVSCRDGNPAVAVTPLPEGMTAFNGVIDMAFLEEDEWVVVDYKTDAVSKPGDLARLTDYYAPQLQVYGHSLTHITGKPVRERHILFLQPIEDVLVPPA